MHGLVAPDAIASTDFRFSRAFTAEPMSGAAVDDDVVLTTSQWRVRAVILRHHGPCLGFTLEEPLHVNIWRNRVEAAGSRARKQA